MLEGFRTYLRPELAKLRDAGDAAALVASGSCGKLVWLPNTSEDVVQAFRGPEQIDFHLAHLSPEESITLASCCRTGAGTMLPACLPEDGRRGTSTFRPGAFS